jgi:hypothetical protein
VPHEPCTHHRLTERCFECERATPAEKPWEVALRKQLTQEYLVLRAVLPQLDERFTSLANRAREAGLTEISRSAAAIAGKLGDL